MPDEINPHEESQPEVRAGKPAAQARDVGPEGFVLVAEAIRGLIQQEFQRAERLDAKARGQFAVAGVLFVAVQAVAGLAITGASVGLTWRVVVLCLVAFGLSALGGALYTSSRVWTLYAEREISPAALPRLLREAREEGVEGVAETLAMTNVGILTDRRQVNADRARALRRSEIWMFAALAIALIEMLTAVAALLFG